MRWLIPAANPDTGAREDSRARSGRRLHPLVLHLELNDWTTWFPTSLASQFERDLVYFTGMFSRPEGMASIQWVFRAPAPVDVETIRDTMSTVEARWSDTPRRSRKSSGPASWTPSTRSPWFASHLATQGPMTGAGRANVVVFARRSLDYAPAEYRLGPELAPRFVSRGAAPMPGSALAEVGGQAVLCLFQRSLVEIGPQVPSAPDLQPWPRHALPAFRLSPGASGEPALVTTDGTVHRWRPGDATRAVWRSPYAARDVPGCAGSPGSPIGAAALALAALSRRGARRR